MKKHDLLTLISFVGLFVQNTYGAAAAAHDEKDQTEERNSTVVVLRRPGVSDSAAADVKVAAHEVANEVPDKPGQQVADEVAESIIGMPTALCQLIDQYTPFFPIIIKNLFPRDPYEYGRTRFPCDEITVEMAGFVATLPPDQTVDFARQKSWEITPGTSDDLLQTLTCQYRSAQNGRTKKATFTVSTADLWQGIALGLERGDDDQLICRPLDLPKKDSITLKADIPEIQIAGN